MDEVRWTSKHLCAVDTMDISTRQYTFSDFQLVSELLIANYMPGNRDGNWLQPAWEYMHSHPNLDESSLGKIGIWEQAGQIVGVAHYESKLGETFFQIHRDFAYLKPEMLAYAESHLYTEQEGEGRRLQVSVRDIDQDLQELVKSKGYKLVAHSTYPMSRLLAPPTIPLAELPEGFVIKSLADENDLRKIHRVLWRGFDHEGEPPEEGLEWRRKMQSGPNFRKDLTIVVEGPSGDFVSFCGLWYEPVNKYAYVEPMATDPDFRRMGLGTAALWEGIRRCAALGAEEVFVGSGQQFYQSIGFTKLYETSRWAREY